MNLKIALKHLSKFLDSTPLKFDYSIEDSVLVATSYNASLKGLDDKISIRIGVFDNDALYVDFIFKGIIVTSKTLFIINQINEKSIWFKAFLDENNYLVVNHSVLCVKDEQMLTEIVHHVLTLVSSDEYIDNLKPLYDTETGVN